MLDPGNRRSSRGDGEDGPEEERIRKVDGGGITAVQEDGTEWMIDVEEPVSKFIVVVSQPHSVTCPQSVPPRLSDAFAALTEE